MTHARVGIRTETTSHWERRTPLTPDHVRSLTGQRIDVVCQPSSLRVHTDLEYQHAGATISQDLSDCPVVLGVKQIREEQIVPDTTYLFFSHTHKAQPQNMRMLRTLIDRGCTLIDYELITDGEGRRQIAFGRFAGFAGMIDALSCLGRRYEAEGFRTPLSSIEPAWRYGSLAAARDAVTAAGRKIAARGLHPSLPPLTCLIAGNGSSGLGAQEIFDLLPTRDLSHDDLLAAQATDALSPLFVYRLTLGTSGLYERREGGVFDREEYRDHPERYRGVLEPLLGRVDLFIHAIYWESPYPRLVTRAGLERAWSPGARPRLRLIADISCDIRGSVEATMRTTTPDEPTFLYLPAEDRAIDAMTGDGPLVLAVDNLPCELPREASLEFGRALLPFVQQLARALDAGGHLDVSRVPELLRRAMIVDRGRLTDRFSYLERFLPESAVG
ncbi:MAG: hypothetical protein OEQ13_11290 [Acidobacteriota bacterium]|nr:hypothetical protein [Acidobacteriota bacterium]